MDTKSIIVVDLNRYIDIIKTINDLVNLFEDCTKMRRENATNRLSTESLKSHQLY